VVLLLHNSVVRYIALSCVIITQPININQIVFLSNVKLALPIEIIIYVVNIDNFHDLQVWPGSNSVWSERFNFISLRKKKTIGRMNGNNIVCTDYIILNNLYSSAIQNSKDCRFPIYIYIGILSTRKACKNLNR